jgi:hypothetical protein
MHRIVAVVAAVVFGLPLVAGAQEKKKDAAAEAVEAQWAEFAKVGEEHKQLARLAGRWKVEVKSLYPNPDQPTTSEGTANFRVLLGGRYLQQNFRGEFEGQEFRGVGISGYDNTKGKYVGAWMDTMGTGIMTTEGEYNADKHELVETGVSSTPMGEAKFKMVSRYLDDDKFVFEMSMLDEAGKETKMMEMTYTRTEAPQKKKKKKAGE